MKLNPNHSVFDRVGMYIVHQTIGHFYDRDFVSLHCLQRLRATFANIPLTWPLINHDFQIQKVRNHNMMYASNKYVVNFSYNFILKQQLLLSINCHPYQQRKIFAFQLKSKKLSNVHCYS